MANNSYVFRNAESDLTDCISALNERILDLEEGTYNPVSREERDLSDRLVKLCQQYLERHAKALELENTSRV